MKPRAFLLQCLSIAALLGASACALDAPTSPAPDIATGPAIAAVSVDNTGAQDGWTQESLKAEHERLKAARDSIKKEQKATKDKNKAPFDSLKKEWDRYKKEWAEYKKENKNAKVELLRCEPQEYAGDAEVIGPNGGELKVGPHKLVIPKGALTRERLIIAEAPMGALVQVRFEPHGLTFKTPSQLTLSYAHCMRPESYTYRIVYVDDNGKTVHEFPPSKDDKTLKEVRASIGHFSSYIVAY